jgi:hypothetical protein
MLVLGTLSVVSVIAYTRPRSTGGTPVAALAGLIATNNMAQKMRARRPILLTSPEA